jgi:hypothetical protein
VEYGIWKRIKWKGNVEKTEEGRGEKCIQDVGGK